MKRAIIVHGWEATPEDNWYPWLKTELERKGFKALVPAMPDTTRPRIKTWVASLAKAAGTVDKETFFIGHSIGCQAVLRYLATTKAAAGGAVLVAPWTTLTRESLPTPEHEATAQEWLETPLEPVDTPPIAIFSDDDPYVPTDNIKTSRNLGARIEIDKGKVHFSSEEGITELPSALDAVLRLA